MQRHLSPQQDVEKVLARMEQGYSWVKLHTATAWSFDQGKDGTIETVKALRDQCGNYDQLKILVRCESSLYDARRHESGTGLRGTSSLTL